MVSGDITTASLLLALVELREKSLGGVLDCEAVDEERAGSCVESRPLRRM